jgi:hypothetical protein
MNGEIAISSRGPVKVKRGTAISVQLHLHQLTVDPPEDVLVWVGETGNAKFLVGVPQGYKANKCTGYASFRVGGIVLTKLYFQLKIGDEESQIQQIPVDEKRYHAVFASYASEDRDAVLARIQGAQKINPNLDIFVDVARLRSGQQWKTELEREILVRDALFLFWSVAASRSKWVDYEWRYALARHGLHFIDPVPLVSPEEVSPPKELSELHFNDWVLPYMSIKGTL